MAHLDLFLGGPDQPAGRLRDLLSERVGAVPPGGSIDWVTYYFRDRRLAEDLLKAHSRGVRVHLTLEGHPRTPHANDAVIGMLSSRHALGDGCRRVVHGSVVPSALGSGWRPHLHEKLYCFSHPQPSALVGSFNPSGDDPERDPGVIREIGDQDRGHNALVELCDPEIVGGLVEHSRQLHTRQHGYFERFSTGANGGLQTADVSVSFWPQARRNPVLRLLRGLGRGSKVRMCASHIKGPAPVGALVGLARRGVVVEILAEATRRRVPRRAETGLAQAGIRIARLVDPAGMPMHNKFMLIESPRERTVVFGSFSWTQRSLWLNHEICVISRSSKLFDSFAARWSEIAAGVFPS